MKCYNEEAVWCRWCYKDFDHFSLYENVGCPDELPREKFCCPVVQKTNKKRPRVQMCSFNELTIAEIIDSFYIHSPANQLLDILSVIGNFFYC